MFSSNEAEVIWERKNHRYRQRTNERIVPPNALQLVVHTSFTQNGAYVYQSSILLWNSDPPRLSFPQHRVSPAFLTSRFTFSVAGGPLLNIELVAIVSILIILHFVVPLVSATFV